MTHEQALKYLYHNVAFMLTSHRDNYNSDNRSRELLREWDKIRKSVDKEGDLV